MKGIRLLRCKVDSVTVALVGLYIQVLVHGQIPIRSRVDNEFVILTTFIRNPIWELQKESSADVRGSV